MEDVELVLRFFAYRHIAKHTGNTVEKFLDEYLKQANKFPNETINELESLFNDTIDIIYQVFDISAFLFPRFHRGRDHKSPTKIIYDSIMQAFAKNIDNKEHLRKNAKEINQNVYNKQKMLINQDKNKSLFDGRYTGRNAVQERIDYYHNFLQNYIS
jgi:hypothetical protein